MLSQSQPVGWAEAYRQSKQTVLNKNDDAHVWVQGWLNQPTNPSSQGVKVSSSAEPYQQPLKKIGFVG
jgi:hypothetical protein